MTDTTKGLKLYNTLTRSKEEFAPIDPANVRMYVCGPTVYDYAHIGNARPAIVFDVLYRLLRHLYGADHVTYVRNITDVDDKINARALRDFGAEIDAGRLSLNEAIRKVTEPTYEQYQKDVTALGCLAPTHQPRATEFVLPRADGRADMVTLIQSLITRGHAYAANGEILFDTASMGDYGKLSRRPLDEQIAGVRIAVESHKKNPQDFVLWKESSAEEPGWPASFTVEGRALAIRGRPGWHIECSAMSSAYLGEVFDIHGGGLDLIFPHHENEIAQSRCAHGTDVMANYWMHNGFLQVEGRKMSKSDGNFVTIDNILGRALKFAMIELDAPGSNAVSDRTRAWNGMGARLSMLQTHYRSPIDWTADRFELSRAEVISWHQLIQTEPSGVTEVIRPDDQVIEALCDDLNTPAALAHVRRLFSAGDWVQLRDAIDVLGLLNVGLLDTFDQIASEVEDLVGDRIDRRLAFIAAKNWAEADKIRDELLAQGIQLKDGKDPTTGERITTWEVKR